MTGSDYRATVRLSTPADETLADVGEVCDRVPEVSLGWLLEQGHIAPVLAPVCAAVGADEPERA